MRKHLAQSYCAVCGAHDPTIGSACIVPKLSSCAQRLLDAERRRALLDLARNTVADGLVIEAVHDGGSEVTLHTCAEVAESERGRRKIIFTGLVNAPDGAA